MWKNIVYGLSYYSLEPSNISLMYLLILICPPFLFCFYSDILHVDGKNVDAIYVRGMSLYYQDNVDKAFTHFQHVLKAAPDHRKALEIYKVLGECSHSFKCYTFIIQ